MQQSGGGAIRDVPATLQGIVVARIDGLPPAEKSLLQAGAVLGKVFWTDALGELSEVEPGRLDELLFALERKEFVRRERRSAVAGARQYAFVHALVRDAAYGQVPRAERSRLHRRAAEWIETLPPDRSDDRAEMLAHHWVEALELARSAGVPWEDMQPYAAAALREAGDRAFALSAFAAAARSYASALELGELEPKCLLAYGQALHLAEFRGEDQYALAAEAALAAGDLETAAEAEMYMGEALWQHGRRDEAFARLDRASALVADAPPSRSKTFVTSSVSRFLMLAGRSEEAIRIGSEARAMAEQLGLEELRAHALNNIGVAKVTSGDLSGLDDLRRSIEIGRGLNSPDVSRGLINLASLTTFLGDVRGGEQLHREALEFSLRFGLLGPEIWARAELAVDAYYAGRWDEAAEHADRVLDASEQTGRFYMEVAARYARAGMRLARGDLSAALADAVATVEQAEGIQDPQVMLPAHANAARHLVAAGRTSEAGVHVDALLAEIEAGSQDLAHEWVVDLAIAMAGLGRSAEFLERAPTLATPTRWLDAALLWAEEDFVRAAAVLEEIGALPIAAEARLRAAEQLVSERRRPEADEQLRRALEFFRPVGATRFVGEGEALFEAAG